MAILILYPRTVLHMRDVYASFCSAHPYQHSPRHCQMSHTTKFETVSKGEPAAKTEENSEERREGTTTNEEKLEIVMEEIVIVKGHQFS